MFGRLITLAALAVAYAPLVPAMAATEQVVTGAFDVKAEAEGTADAPIGTYKLTKTYHGELDGTGIGKMLGVGTPIEGSAAYVALEQVNGTLSGHSGGFALIHKGTMGHGAQHLEIAIVPDSGTGALKGISGSLDIRIESGKHFYTLRLANLAGCELQ
jgi:hypothetical protein